MKNNKYLLLIIVSIFLLFFLVSNIIFSQTISPLFSQVVNGDKKAVIEYLKKIKSQSEFKKELEYYKNTYGVEIERQVFEEDRKREEKIKEYKLVLQKNSKSRDVLYGLYLLYQSKGDNRQAQGYLEMAKEVDPTINIKN